MLPEESRLKYYDKVSDADKCLVYDEDNNVDIKFVDPDDICGDLVTDIMSIFLVMVDSLSFDQTYLDFVKHTQFFFLDQTSCFVLLDLNDYSAGLFMGRNKNNLYASKRFISNLAGKYSKKMGNKYSITLDVKQLMDNSH